MLNTGAFCNALVRLNDDPLIWLQPFRYFGSAGRAHAGFNERAHSFAIFYPVHGPTFAHTKQRRAGNLQHVLGLLHDEFDLYPVAIAQRGPLLVRRDQIKDDARAALQRPGPILW